MLTLALTLPLCFSFFFSPARRRRRRTVRADSTHEPGAGRPRARTRQPRGARDARHLRRSFLVVGRRCVHGAGQCAGVWVGVEAAAKPVTTCVITGCLSYSVQLNVLIVCCFLVFSLTLSLLIYSFKLSLSPSICLYISISLVLLVFCSLAGASLRRPAVHSLPEAAARVRHARHEGQHAGLTALFLMCHTDEFEKSLCICFFFSVSSCVVGNCVCFCFI